LIAKGVLDGRANDAYHEPVTRPRRRSAPVPVVAAVVVLLLVAAIPGRHVVTSGSSLATGLLAALLLVALAYGLWRGSGRARFWTTVFSTAAVLYGAVTFVGGDVSGLLQSAGAAVVVGLLVAPASSRRWFDDRPVAE
jgi:hypothetical protein